MKNSTCRSSLRQKLEVHAVQPVLSDMYNDTDLLAFPELTDEAVVALNQLLESFYTHFQNHYFAQIHRWHHKLDQRQQYNNQLPLPLDDPPF